MKKFPLFMLLYATTLCAQEPLSNRAAYEWFDSILGHENLAICSGEKHSENYRTVRGEYPFFRSNEYSSSEIKYKNQVYYNVQIKYNVSDDELVAFIPTAIDKYPIVLSKEHVDYFFINERKFTNLKDFGYSEVLSENKTNALYQRYTKNRLQKTTSSGIVYSFREKSRYLLFHNKTYKYVSSRNDWIKSFPNKKSLIKSHYSSNRKLLKSNPDAFMTKLYNLLVL